VGGHCIPVYPRLYLWNDPEATVVSAARAANAGMPDYTIGLLEGAYGDLAGARVVVLGAAYRGGVKETALSGVFGAVDALRARGAVVLVHDPMYSDDELGALGFTPYHLGEPVDAAVVQADHAEYRALGPADLPGITAFIDGRRVSSADRWPGVAYRVIGTAPVAA
jgi:UDP-N-acetyl-D-mannosaminuronate dehydrogenase